MCPLRDFICVKNLKRKTKCEFWGTIFLFGMHSAVHVKMEAVNPKSLLVSCIIIFWIFMVFTLSEVFLMCDICENFV